MSRATINDVARLAGVARTTVSRVLNDADYVSAESRSAVERAMATLDYRPRASARTLRRPEPTAVRVSVDDPTDPFSARVLRGALRAASTESVPVLISLSSTADAEESPVEVRGILRVVGSRNLERHPEDARVLTVFVGPNDVVSVAGRGEGDGAEALGADAMRRLAEGVRAAPRAGA